MKIAIDPGHGMSNRQRNVFDPGATHNENGMEFREADIALKYALSLKEVFVQNGHGVFMTRDDHSDQAPVGERAGNAERAGCDAFISLHLNDFDDDAAHGFEVLFRGDDDKPFAQALQDALVGVTRFRDRGIKQRTDLAVLKFNGTAVLIELGFIANDDDRNALLNPAMRAVICETVVRLTAEHVGEGRGGRRGGGGGRGGGGDRGGDSDRGGGRDDGDNRGGGGDSGPGVVPTARVAVPIDDTLTVRDAPRQSGRPVDALANGTVVSIFASDGIWRRIDPPPERWVSSHFLVPVGTDVGDGGRGDGGRGDGGDGDDGGRGDGGGGGSADLSRITDIAASSAIARFNWPQRGVAPIGYYKGMALTFARVLCKLQAGDPAAQEMAKAATTNATRDALAHYAEQFSDLGMDNSVAGPHTLRHLFALMIGLGMRESSGRHCCGRDTTADNTSGDGAEAGLFQTSFDARGASPLMRTLFDHYLANPKTGFLDVFHEGVRCSEADLANHGSGEGRQYQELAKQCPAFHAEFTAVGMRHLRRHWGPLNTRAAKIMPDADRMLREVQAAVEGGNLCPLLA